MAKLKLDLENEISDYYKNKKYKQMKTKNKFIQFTCQLMTDKLDNAIERAIKLEEYHSAAIIIW